MPLNFQDILDLPDGERVKWLSQKRSKKKKTRTVALRVDRTREELLEYLRKKKFTTIPELESGRDSDDPDLWDYKKEFGTWGGAKNHAYGDGIDLQPDVSAEYMAKTVVEFGLWSYRKFCEARRNNPKVVPSTYLVFKKFGSWDNLKYLARRYSLKVTLEEYCKLARRLGRKPRWVDCRQAGLEIYDAAKFFGGKGVMDEYLTQMEILNAVP